MLSVATASVDARQRLIALTVIFALAATSFALLPIAAIPLGVSIGALPFLLGIALASDFVTAYLLFSQFMTSRLLGTAFLGGAYVIAGLDVLAYLVTFPGVLGTSFAPQAAAWLWVVWHIAFPLAVCLALWFDRENASVRERKVAARWVRGILTGAILVGAVPALIVIARGPALPILLHGESYAPFWRSGIGQSVVVVNLLALVLAIGWTRGRTVLHTWLIVALVAACLDVQMSLAGSARFTLGWYVSRFLVVCSSTAVLFACLRQMHVLFAKLSDLSMVDGLTELPNRRYFEMRLESEVRSAHREGRPLALLIADVDAFKQYNDNYGHLAGDEALRAVAKALQLSAMRPGDVIGRWGGEEFVACLPETDRDGAYLVAERLRAAIQALAILHRRTPVAGKVVTISVGIALLGARDDGIEPLIERADTALYRAKSGGRNTIAIELPPPERPQPLRPVVDAVFEEIEIDRG